MEETYADAIVAEGEVVYNRTCASTHNGPAIWVRQWDGTSSAFYYLNPLTGATSWEKPPEYVETTALDDEEQDSERNNLDMQHFEFDKAEQENGHVSGYTETMVTADNQGQWMALFDPSLKRTYYYNIISKASQWDRPVDFLDGVQDEKVDGAVKIQSVFRSKKARDRVNALHNDVLSKEGTVTHREQWSQHFDPRSRRYYFRNVTSGIISWGKPIGCEIVSKEDQHDEAATVIQCFFRKRTATRRVDFRRRFIHEITDAVAIDQKINSLKDAVDDIQDIIKDRELLSTDEEQQFSHLQDLIVSWSQSHSAIKDRVLGLRSHAELIQQANSKAEKMLIANQLHQVLVDLQQDCVVLRRNILMMNSYFVDLDVARINNAFDKFRSWDSRELLALTDTRILESVQVDDVKDLISRVEVLLISVMGPADFSAGVTTACGKRYEDWHGTVKAALEGVSDLEHNIARNINALRLHRIANVERQEQALMEHEDFSSLQTEMEKRRLLHQAEDHAKFLAKCRESWTKGILEYQEDTRVISSKDIGRRHKERRAEENSAKMSDHDLARRKKLKLSIWEAVKEGLPVDIIRVMIFAEMQKARQLGYDFVLRTARSEHGETLIQIACWWGHEHLVSYFLCENANAYAVDTLYNQFSLLHDAARRGHSQIIRILLQHGLKYHIVDSSGDTPLHWAARKNHYECVHILLGAEESRHDEQIHTSILKAIRSKNNRGRTPFQVAKSDYIRDLIQARDEGRIPLVYRRRVESAGARASRRMTDIGYHEQGSAKQFTEHKLLHKAISSKNLSSNHDD